jgi:tetratricopeptide (TPR) repeat protein
MGQNTQVRQTLFFTICFLLFSLTAQAQSSSAPEKYLEAAVAALEVGDNELGLLLLQKAGERSDDPRIGYYTAYALEKTGRCDEAKRGYEKAIEAGPERFAAAARDALSGLAARCGVPAVEAPETGASGSSDVTAADDVPVRSRRGRGTGWRILGWVSASLGAVALGVVPVKNAVDHKAAEQAEQPFEEAYSCSIDFGEIGKECDEDAVRSNPYWPIYEDKIGLAKRTNVYLIAGGATLLALGVTAFVLGATRPAVAVVPNSRGMSAVLVVPF